jgi:hypothetical protein
MMIISSEKLTFLEYKVIDEPWNVYKLADGSTLRVRIIVSGIIKESETALSIQAREVYNVIPNPEYLGVPSLPLKPNENIDAYIEAEDLKITEKTDYWNTYSIPSENLVVAVKGELVEASRTSRHDEKGIPVYRVNVQLLFKPKKKAKQIQ